MKTDPVKTVHVGAAAIRRLIAKFGVGEVSPEAMACAVLQSAGVVTHNDYLRALWAKDGPPKGNVRRATLKRAGLPQSW